MAVWDAWDALVTLADRCATLEEKTAALFFFALSAVGPGGGYGRIAKGARHPVVWKALQRGRREHARYFRNMAAKGYKTNATLPGTRLRPDAWQDMGSVVVIRELKPYTLTGIKQGMKDLSKYREAAQIAFPDRVILTFPDYYY